MNITELDDLDGLSEEEARARAREYLAQLWHVNAPTNSTAEPPAPQPYPMRRTIGVTQRGAVKAPAEPDTETDEVPAELRKSVLQLQRIVRNAKPAPSRLKFITKVMTREAFAQRQALHAGYVRTKVLATIERVDKAMHKHRVARAMAALGRADATLARLGKRLEARAKAAYAGR